MIVQGSLSEELPKAVWIPKNGYEVYRGDPSQIVLELLPEAKGPKRVTNALKGAIELLARSHKVRIKLPWERSEEDLAKMFVSSLLQMRILHPVASA
jgi:hypothetical protein